jgi:hypothetical protein
MIQAVLRGKWNRADLSRCDREIGCQTTQDKRSKPRTARTCSELSGAAAAGASRPENLTANTNGDVLDRGIAHFGRRTLFNRLANIHSARCGDLRQRTLTTPPTACISPAYHSRRQPAPLRVHHSRSLARLRSSDPLKCDIN